MNDDAVEAVVDKRQQIAEQLGEQVHGSHHEIRYGPNKSDVEPASAGSMARASVSPTRSATSNGAPPTMTGASSPSVNLSCSQPRTGDAWLLDPADQLAARLARDGDPEPIHIEENDTTFAIGWKGRYRIEGPAFIYVDHDTGQLSTILGYPTHQLK